MKALMRCDRSLAGCALSMASTRKVIPIAPVAGSSDDGAQFVSMYQKQATIYPRAVKGWFAAWRWVFVWLTQLLFYGAPGCSGADARPCCSIWRRSASTSSACCSIHRT
jgi:hypothetical protein